MLYRNITGTDLNCSVIGLGTWGMGGVGWARSGKANDEESIAVIRRAIELGVNLIDTAQPYGAEELYQAACSDKKIRGGTMNIVVPTAIGRCELMKIQVSDLRDWIEMGLEA